MNVAVIVLIIIGCVFLLGAIWAIVETALLVRKIREKADRLTDKLAVTLNEVNDTIVELEGTIKSLDPAIAQVAPLLQKVEDTLDDAAPAVAELGPLVKKAGETIDSVTQDLNSVDSILGNVGTISKVGADASTSVQRTVSNATNAAAKGFTKLSRRMKDNFARMRGMAPEPVEDEPEQEPEHMASSPVEETAGAETYFTYPGTSGEAVTEPVDVTETTETPAAEATARYQHGRMQ